MTTNTLSQSAVLNLASTGSPEDSIHHDRASRSRRGVTVYDAVAGRGSSAGFIPKNPFFASTRDNASSSAAAVHPEAVLFRRKNAPTRFAEHDIYFANERQSVTDLPDSDLLKALHCYTSDFYSRAAPDAGSGDWKSLDETGLIALGILMEEASRLAHTSDLALAEGTQITDNLALASQHPIDPPMAFRRSNSKLIKQPAKRRRIDRISVGE